MNWSTLNGSGRRQGEKTKSDRPPPSSNSPVSMAATAYRTIAKRLRSTDGSAILGAHLFQAQTPQEPKYPYDRYKLPSAVPGDKAFGFPEESARTLVNAAAK
ncbi:MAG: hypothetical protein KDJ25_04560 [Rhodoblastus sp.]|nr:hypothetical protein [Rhodoblastus sp.]